MRVKKKGKPDLKRSAKDVTTGKPSPKQGALRRKKKKDKKE